MRSPDLAQPSATVNRGLLERSSAHSLTCCLQGLLGNVSDDRARNTSSGLFQQKSLLTPALRGHWYNSFMYIPLRKKGPGCRDNKGAVSAGEKKRKNFSHCVGGRGTEAGGGGTEKHGQGLAQASLSPLRKNVTSVPAKAAARLAVKTHLTSEVLTDANQKDT